MSEQLNLPFAVSQEEFKEWWLKNKEELLTKFLNNHVKVSIGEIEADITSYQKFVHTTPIPFTIYGIEKKSSFFYDCEREMLYIIVFASIFGKKETIINPVGRDAYIQAGFYEVKQRLPLIEDIVKYKVLLDCYTDHKIYITTAYVSWSF